MSATWSHHPIPAPHRHGGAGWLLGLAAAVAVAAGAQAGVVRLPALREESAPQPVSTPPLVALPDAAARLGKLGLTCEAARSGLTLCLADRGLVTQSVQLRSDPAGHVSSISVGVIAVDAQVDAHAAKLLAATVRELVEDPAASQVATWLRTRTAADVAAPIGRLHLVVTQQPYGRFLEISTQY